MTDVQSDWYRLGVMDLSSEYAILAVAPTDQPYAIDNSDVVRLTQVLRGRGAGMTRRSGTLVKTCLRRDWHGETHEAA